MIKRLLLSIGLACAAVLVANVIVILSVQKLDRDFPDVNLTEMTYNEVRAELGEPTNRYYGPFSPNWSREIRVFGVLLAEKTIFAHTLWDDNDEVAETRIAWRFPWFIFFNHGYEQGFAVGLFCYREPFHCRLEI